MQIMEYQYYARTQDKQLLLPLQFQISPLQIIQMGNICQQTQTFALDVIESKETSTIDSYEQADWPEDPHLLTLMQQLKSSIDFGVIFTSKVFKHKTNGKYYQGEWDQAGYQRGKGILFRPNRYLYYGQFDSVPHGLGVLKMIEGQFVYEGHFNHGRGEGEAKIIKQGQFAFEGTIKESLPTNGLLKITGNHQTKNCSIAFHNYPKQPSIVTYTDGKTYQGQLEPHTFEPDGQGTATFIDGSSYEGTWKEGLMHGKGKFTWKDQSFYEGEYAKGKKQGRGKFIYRSKNYYDGEWADGKQDGNGTLFDSEGQILKVGEWREGYFISE